MMDSPLVKEGDVQSKNGVRRYIFPQGVVGYVPEREYSCFFALLMSHQLVL